MRLYLSIFIIALLAAGCETEPSSQKKLPFLGRKQVVKQGETNQRDTIYHTIPHFKFMDQDSNWVTPETLRGHIYVADFFFTSCKTICPVLKRHMLQVYKRFKDNKRVKLVSHTIDPRHDSIPVLKAYAQELGVSSKKWHFVRGPQEKIYKIAESYLVSAAEDSTAQGGYVHSGAFLLVDDKGRIRGNYDGTDQKEVNKLMQDMERLLNARFNNS